MKLAGVLLSVFLILFVAAFVVVNYSLSIFQNLIQVSSSPLFLFSLFNTIILAIIVGSYKPYTYEVDEVLTFSYYSNEVDEFTDDNNITDNGDRDDNDGYYGSDGYEEDDDDSGSYDEVGWDDEEGYDDNLHKRVEDFIAKVNNGWREERLREKLWMAN